MVSLNICQSCAPAEVLQASQGVYHQKSAHRAKTAVLTASTWNVRSMVDTEGPIEIASNQHSHRRGEDRKVDQIVLELMNYGVSVGALQETKWFGDNVYEVQGSVVVTAGRPTPADGEPIQRGEGVALVLMGSALAAWRRGGKQWKAWSSRCVSALLAFTGRTGRLHVLSCYAPTRAAQREDKEDFFNQLAAFMSSVPVGEHYVILGDFNARVGSRSDVDADQWSGVLGPHGCGVANDAGRELLSFLSCQEATICNTWFEKRAVCRQTWQHPKSKKWSCIDFVVMSQRDRRYCLDVTVRRGAFCNTDHHLVCTRLYFGRRHCSGASGRGNHWDKMMRYDVGKLSHDDSASTCYLETVLERFSESWSVNGTLAEKWQVVKAALTSAAGEVLGFLLVINQIGLLTLWDFYSHCLPVGMQLILNG